MYRHATRGSVSDQGWPLTQYTKNYIFPNRDVPDTQPTSSGIGWPSATADEWLIEFQVYLGSTTELWLRTNSDADYALGPAPVRYYDFELNGTSGQLTTLWDDRTGNSYTYNNATGVVSSGVFLHFAAQKAAGAHTVRVFLDGVYRLTLYPGTPISNIDMLYLKRGGSGTGGVLVRDFNVRSSAPYASGGFASALGDKRLRWNSMML